jgi:hypothetical protein
VPDALTQIRPITQWPRAIAAARGSRRHDGTATPARDNAGPALIPGRLAAGSGFAPWLLTDSLMEGTHG